MKVTRSITNTAGTEEIYPGDVVEINLDIVLENTQRKEYAYVLLEDPIPAGLVVINTALSNEMNVTSYQTSSDANMQNWNRQGYYNLVPDFNEIHDDKVLAFRRRMWAYENWTNVYRYSYYARAVCAGTFQMPSTKVQMMYQPEICAYTPTKTLVIHERQ
jgi:uncharacterized protein YfaS (alpha-2-macroglobulin family)